MKKQYHLQQNRVKMILFLLKLTNFWGEKRKLKQKTYISKKNPARFQLEN